jgi:hypothetical protein
MLCYKLLGDEAQSSFARSWGISYGVGAAAEWKDIVTEAAKAAILLAILERLFLTRPASWVESNVDYLSTQARAACTLNRSSANAPLTRRLCVPGAAVPARAPVAVPADAPAVRLPEARGRRLSGARTVYNTM